MDEYKLGLQDAFRAVLLRSRKDGQRGAIDYARFMADTIEKERLENL